MNADPKRVITWLLAVTVPIAAAAVISGYLFILPTATLTQIATQHFPAVVGLPLAALLAAFVVVSFHQSAGPIKFEGLGFKFEGGSGQVVLWVFCFLAISAAIRLLWSVE